MKKLLPLLLLATTPVYANIKQEFVTSAQISIDSPYVITNAAPSSYSISGNNITTSTGSGDNIVTNGIGGLNLSSITNGLAGVTATNKTVTTAGSLALTSLSSGVHTCTAGGSGTSCIGSTTVRITID